MLNRITNVQFDGIPREPGASPYRSEIKSYSGSYPSMNVNLEASFSFVLGPRRSIPTP